MQEHFNAVSVPPYMPGTQLQHSIRQLSETAVGLPSTYKVCYLVAQR